MQGLFIKIYIMCVKPIHVSIGTEKRAVLYIFKLLALSELVLQLRKALVVILPVGCGHDCIALFFFATYLPVLQVYHPIYAILHMWKVQ